MSNSIIIAENLSKSYLVGHRAKTERYTALRDVIARSAWNVGRKSLDLFRGQQLVYGDEVERFWALQDVSFEVEQGEVLGIIGRNGAGKSTLLKILSRITEPDRGRAILRGRVASLLEVGTGFHPELTGRENIFLNGAVLGMEKAEIKSKFDEIVSFAEVERFLDTPVKRYSSGMYMRLAFSVAAHLNPEILIIDEVLAVGDAEFQTKCLGKMQTFSKAGRTILFVSHNMAAIKSLTVNAILLNAGTVTSRGPTEQVVQDYTQINLHSPELLNREKWGHGTHTAIRGANLLNSAGQPTSTYLPGEPLRVEILLETDGTKGLSLELILTDAVRARLALASLYQFQRQSLPDKKGTYKVHLSLAPVLLASGRYEFDITTSVPNSCWDHYVETAVIFDVPFCNPLGHPWDFRQISGLGSVALLCANPAEFAELSVSSSALENSAQ
jgi:lipopolysaccharide transport system ATP-binding protein